MDTLIIIEVDLHLVNLDLWILSHGIIYLFRIFFNSKIIPNQLKNISANKRALGVHRIVLGRATQGLVIGLFVHSNPVLIQSFHSLSSSKEKSKMSESIICPM